MNIHEHQAKEIFKKFGIKVPNGITIFSLNEIDQKIKILNTNKIVLKAQIHAGGRGKAGGIKIVDSVIQLKNEAKKLLPHNNYIGFSLTHANEKRIKHWPLNKFIDLANIIETKNKIPVFFVEKTNQEIINEIKSKVPKALFPEHQSSLASPALVTALASRLEMAISIDNGIMHMMSLSDVPMIVLFGPTKPEKFAPKKDKIIILDSKKLYKNSDISKITVDDVIKHIL